MARPAGLDPRRRRAWEPARPGQQAHGRDRLGSIRNRRGRAGPHVLQALAGRDLGLVEARAVVDDADEALARPLLDPHLGPACARMLARVREPLLDDPEDLDLLVGGEPDPILDLEVDLELAIGREEVDVTAESRVEGCRA